MLKAVFFILSLLLCGLAVNAQNSSYGIGKVEGNITACVGMASASPNIQQFVVTAAGLTTPMNIQAPQFFEVSLTPNGGYSNLVSIMPVNGDIPNTTIYARSTATAPLGSISGRCSISIAGTSQTSAVTIFTATVYTLPVVNTISNQVLLSGKLTQPVNFSGTGNTYTWINNTPSIGLAPSGDGNIAPFTAVNNGTTPVVATISVTAISAGFAYITNSDDGTVSVINTVTNKVVTNITVGSQPYGITLSEDGSTAYVTNRGSGTISVIDTKTNTVTKIIPTGSGPIGILFYRMLSC